MKKIYALIAILALSSCDKARVYQVEGGKAVTTATEKYQALFFEVGLKSQKPKDKTKLSIDVQSRSFRKQVFVGIKVKNTTGREVHFSSDDFLISYLSTKEKKDENPLPDSARAEALYASPADLNHYESLSFKTPPLKNIAVAANGSLEFIASFTLSSAPEKFTFSVLLGKDQLASDSILFVDKKQEK